MDTAERLRLMDENVRTEPNERELMVKAIYLFRPKDGVCQFHTTLEIRSMYPFVAKALFGLTDNELDRVLQRCDAIDAYTSAQK